MKKKISRFRILECVVVRRFKIWWPGDQTKKKRYFQILKSVVVRRKKKIDFCD